MADAVSVIPLRERRAEGGVSGPAPRPEPSDEALAPSDGAYHTRLLRACIDADQGPSARRNWRRKLAPRAHKRSRAEAHTPRPGEKIRRILSRQREPRTARRRAAPQSLQGPDAPALNWTPFLGPRGVGFKV